MVMMVKCQQKITKKQVCNELAAAERQVSVFTDKRALHQHIQRGCHASPLLKAFNSLLWGTHSYMPKDHYRCQIRLNCICLSSWLCMNK